MRISIYGMIRLTTLLIMVTTMTGVAVNRLVPSNPINWILDFGQPWTVAKHNLHKPAEQNLILDLEHDQEILLPIKPNEKLELISISPFSNEKGNRQMVCRRQSSSLNGSSNLPGDVELVRMSFPNMEILESRSVDWLPNSLPAWDIDTSHGLKTVFSTGSGSLVRVDWEDKLGRAVSHKGQLIHWDVDPPFGNQTFVSDPEWVSDNNFPNRILVALWGISPVSRTFHAGLAWLDLNEDRTTIEAYGILIDKDLGMVNNAQFFRNPVSKTDRNGQTQIAWQDHLREESGWTTRTAFLEEVPGSTKPARNWRLGASQWVASGCLNTKVAFDEQSQNLYLIVPKSADCYDGGYWRKHRLLDQQELVTQTDRRPLISMRAD